MKIDVVYKLGIGSKRNDLELRYSLRSLAHFKDLGQVFIIGHKPSWIQNIIHIPAQDVFTTNKDANLINKLVLACCDSRTSHYFLNMSDDQVFLKECKYEDFIIPYYDNSLINFKPEERLGRWKTRLKNTIKTLGERKLATNCYEAHIPTLIDKYNYTQIVFQYNYPEGQGMCGNTLYFNSLGETGQPIPEKYALKLDIPYATTEAIEKACEGLLHFNYAEASENDILFGYLANKFSVKSKFEAD